MTEIIFHQGFVICQLASPNKRIRKSTFADSLKFIPVKYIIDPVQIFAVVHIGYFRSVYVKRVHRYAPWNIVPVAHYVFFSSPHGKSTSLDEYQTWSGPLFLLTGYLVTTHILIIIVPTGHS